MKRQSPPISAFAQGGGEMGALMRSCDWASTPLGPPSTWPESLRSALGLCLDSAFPIAIYWGPQLALLYNDAWRPILGDKHPWGLGRSAREVWPEIWDAIDPVFAQVLATGKGVFNGDSLLAINRFGYVEECYFDYTFNPIRSGAEIAGIFNVVIETTDRVIGERRAHAQRDFAARLAAAKSVDQVLALAAGSVAEHAMDVPFALIYRIAADGRTAELAHAVGLQAGTAASPMRVALDAQTAWPLGKVARTGQAERVSDLGALFGPLPGGPWPEAAHEALVLPVSAAGSRTPPALLVAGISPRRALDDGYQAFFESLGVHMASAMMGAEAFENQTRRAEALAELDRAKTTFFSNVSHEFRTPLTLILGPLEDVLAKPPSEILPANRAALEVVQRNAERLLKLVNTLLDFARIEAGRTQASYEPCDLAALTADLASNFRSACDRAGLKLEVDCPPLAEPAYVDREMWEKIVLNLLSNAFKFTFAGKIAVVIRQAAKAFELSVRDTGTGIPAAELPRMFERFHRVEGARGRSHEGSGIGLALVQELVRLHGGTIGVDSTPGEGTTFTVSIPKGAAHLPAERIKAPRQADSTSVRAGAYVDEALSWLPQGESAPATARPDGLPRVLLADDNEDLRAYARRVLAEHYDVETVADGEAALAAARRRKPDLVVSDVMMPRLDGFGLIRALREEAALRDVPIVLLSARAGEEARIEGLGKGADEYLVKPFSARELLVRVGALLRSADIRREAEEALRESESRLREFLNAAPAILWVTGPDGSRILRSRGWTELTGQAEAEALGFGWIQAVHPEDRRQAEKIFLDANLQRAPFSIDYRLRHKDGEYCWAIDSGRPRFAPTGEFLGYIGSVIDVHERKQAENALRDSEARKSAMFETALDCIVSMDHHGRVVEFNPAAEHTFGYQREKVLGKELAELIIPPRLRDQHRKGLARFLATGEGPVVGKRIEMPALRSDGMEFPVELTVTRIPTEGLPLFTAYLRDITERKRAQEALQEADRRKDEFIATLSHELRNPLAPLRNSLHLLRLSGGTGAASAPIHEMMERQVNHLVRLVDDLLEMSRVTRGAFELRRERVELASIVRNAIETSEPLIRAGGHNLSVSLPQEALWVEGDPVRLAQILANVLNNAAKYTEKSGNIALRARRDGAAAVLSVRDDGVGIAPEQLGRVFDMFSRGERSSGLGIGLALARRLAEMHGGTIEVASEGPGKGAEITLRLPLAQTGSPETTGPKEVEPSLIQKRILVVDDNHDAADSLGMLLKFLGADVQVAHHGREALAAFDDYRPAIVLLDIGMPEMDGYEVARAIRKRVNGARVPIVALTGWGQEEDRRRARDAGFDHHLVKPADISALQSLLASLKADQAGAQP